MNSSIRILLLEDSETDAELIRHELRRSGMQAITERVDCRKAFIEALGTFSPHVVLSDHALADFDANAALDIVRTVAPGTPFIIVTGAINGQKSVACLRAGAEDLILKTNISRLAASIADAMSIREPLRTLTGRQLEVLRLMAEGYRTREIAARLKLSVKTIESHRGEIMKRLSVHQLVGLVRYALRVGLVGHAPNSADSPWPPEPRAK